MTISTSLNAVAAAKTAASDPQNTTTPLFSEPVVTGDLCLGGTISIDFQVYGYPEPHILWFKNNQEIELGDRINLFSNMEGGYTLEIQGLCPEDQGDYSFIAENEFGETTCVVQIQDLSYQTPQTSPGNHSHDSQPPVTSSGHLSYPKLHRSRRCRSAVTPPQPPHFMSNDEHAEDYWFENTNTSGEKIAPYAAPGLSRNPNTELESDRSYQPPVFQGDPVLSGHLVEGGELVVELRLVSHPEPRVHWYKDGRAGIFSERIRMERGMNDCYKLVIKNIRRDDEGEYSFVAENYLGKNRRTIVIQNIAPKAGTSSCRAQSQVRVLPQKESPRISPAHLVGEVKRGREVSVEFQVISEDTPDIKLFKHGLLVSFEGRISLVRDSAPNYAIIFRDLSVEDKGVYHITACNVAGSSFTTFELGNLTPPRAVARPWKSTSPASHFPRTVPLQSTVEMEPSPIPAAPAFTRPLVTGQMCVGGSLRIQFALSGSPSPTIRWYKNGQQFSLGQRLQLEHKLDTKYCLLLPVLRHDDEGMYEFVASNSIGEAVCSLQITPANPSPSSDCTQYFQDNRISIEEMPRSVSRSCQPPKFSKPELSGEMMLGGTIHLRFSVDAEPPAEVRLYKNNKPLSFDHRINMTQDHLGIYTLTVRDICYSDEARYMMKATNDLGEAKCTITLSIQQASHSQRSVDYSRTRTNQRKKMLSCIKFKDIAPSFIEDIPYLHRVHCGGKLILSAKVVKNPMTMVIWYKDGIKVLEDDCHIVTVATKNNFIVSNLLILNATAKDTGHYICQAANPHGESRQKCHVTVTLGPQSDAVKYTGTCYLRAMHDAGLSQWSPFDRGDIIRHTPAVPCPKFNSVSSPVIYKTFGEQTNFNVDFNSTPDTKVIWYKDGSQIGVGEDSRKRVVATVDDNCRQVSTLHIADLRVEDSGQYTAKALNSRGEVQYTSELSVCDSSQINTLRRSEDNCWVGDNSASPFDLISPEVQKELSSVLVIYPTNKRDNLSSETVGTGDPIKMDVNFKKLPAGTKLIWYKNGKQIYEDKKRIFTITEYFGKESTSSSLLIVTASPEDEGIYTCKAIRPKSRAPIRRSSHVYIRNKRLGSNYYPDIPVFSHVSAAQKNAVEAGEVKLCAQINAHPQTKVMWYKDSKRVNEDRRKTIHYTVSENMMSTTLHIREVRLEDRGFYTIKVISPNGKEAEHVTELKVLQWEGPVKPPSTIQTPPQTVKTCRDTCTRLDVELETTPDTKVVWYKDDCLVNENQHCRVVIGMFEEKMTTSLVFPKVQPDDAGSYTMKAVSSQGVTDIRTRLEVNEKIKEIKPINKSINIVRVVENERGQIDAKFITGSPSKVCWYKSGKLVTTDHRRKVITFQHDDKIVSSLVFLKVRPTDMGEYVTELISNDGMSAKCHSMLKLNNRTHSQNNISQIDSTLDNLCIPPQIISQPKWPREIDEKGSMQLTSQISGNSSNIVWIKDGMPITEDERVTITTTNTESMIYSTLRIDNVNPNDEGQYVLHISNKFGESNSVADVKVYCWPEESLKPVFIPSWEDKLQNATDGRSGEKAQINVKLEAHPDTVVTWYKDGKTLEENYKKFLTYTNFHKHIIYSLLLDDLIVSDGGKYVVKAISPIGEVAEHVTELVVSDFEYHRQPPRFLSSVEQKIEAVIGKPTQLDIYMDASADTKVRWFKDGIAVEDDQRRIVTVAIFDRTLISTLSITELQLQDKGRYIIQAENEEGVSTSFATIDICPVDDDEACNLCFTQEPIAVDREWKISTEFSQHKLISNVTNLREPSQSEIVQHSRSIYQALSKVTTLHWDSIQESNEDIQVMSANSSEIIIDDLTNGCESNHVLFSAVPLECQKDWEENKESAAIETKQALELSQTQLDFENISSHYVFMSCLPTKYDQNLEEAEMTDKIAYVEGCKLIDNNSYLLETSLDITECWAENIAESIALEDHNIFSQNSELNQADEYVELSELCTEAHKFQPTTLCDNTMNKITDESLAHLESNLASKPTQSEIEQIASEVTLSLIEISCNLTGSLVPEDSHSVVESLENSLKLSETYEVANFQTEIPKSQPVVECIATKVQVLNENIDDFEALPREIAVHHETEPLESQTGFISFRNICDIAQEINCAEILDDLLVSHQLDQPSELLESTCLETETKSFCSIAHCIPLEEPVSEEAYCLAKKETCKVFDLNLKSQLIKDANSDYVGSLCNFTEEMIENDLLNELRLAEKCSCQTLTTASETNYCCKNEEISNTNCNLEIVEADVYNEHLPTECESVHISLQHVLDTPFLIYTFGSSFKELTEEDNVLEQSKEMIILNALNAKESIEQGTKLMLEVYYLALNQVDLSMEDNLEQNQLDAFESESLQQPKVFKYEHDFFSLFDEMMPEKYCLVVEDIVAEDALFEFKNIAAEKLDVIEIFDNFETCFGELQETFTDFSLDKQPIDYLDDVVENQKDLVSSRRVVEYLAEKISFVFEVLTNERIESISEDKICFMDDLNYEIAEKFDECFFKSVASMDYCNGFVEQLSEYVALESSLEYDDFLFVEAKIIEHVDHFQKSVCNFEEVFIDVTLDDQVICIINDMVAEEEEDMASSEITDACLEFPTHSIFETLAIETLDIILKDEIFLAADAKYEIINCEIIGSTYNESCALIFDSHADEMADDIVPEIIIPFVNEDVACYLLKSNEKEKELYELIRTEIKTFFQEENDKFIDELVNKTEIQTLVDDIPIRFKDNYEIVEEHVYASKVDSERDFDFNFLKKLLFVDEKVVDEPIEVFSEEEEESIAIDISNEEQKFKKQLTTIEITEENFTNSTAELSFVISEKEQAYDFEKLEVKVRGDDQVDVLDEVIIDILHKAHLEEQVCLDVLIDERANEMKDLYISKEDLTDSCEEEIAENEIGTIDVSDEQREFFPSHLTTVAVTEDSDIPDGSGISISISEKSELRELEQLDLKITSNEAQEFVSKIIDFDVSTEEICTDQPISVSFDVREETLIDDIAEKEWESSSNEDISLYQIETTEQELEFRTGIESKFIVGNMTSSAFNGLQLSVHESSHEYEIEKMDVTVTAKDIQEPTSEVHQFDISVEEIEHQLPVSINIAKEQSDDSSIQKLKEDYFHHEVDVNEVIEEDDEIAFYECETSSQCLEFSATTEIHITEDSNAIHLPKGIQICVSEDTETFEREEYAIKIKQNKSVSSLEGEEVEISIAEDEIALSENAAVSLKIATSDKTEIYPEPACVEPVYQNVTENASVFMKDELHFLDQRREDILTILEQNEKTMDEMGSSSNISCSSIDSEVSSGSEVMFEIITEDQICESKDELIYEITTMSDSSEEEATRISFKTEISEEENSEAEELTVRVFHDEMFSDQYKVLTLEVPFVFGKEEKMFENGDDLIWELLSPNADNQVPFEGISKNEFKLADIDEVIEYGIGIETSVPIAFSEETKTKVYTHKPILNEVIESFDSCETLSDTSADVLLSTISEEQHLSGKNDLPDQDTSEKQMDSIRVHSNTEEQLRQKDIPGSLNERSLSQGTSIHTDICMSMSSNVMRSVRETEITSLSQIQ